MAHLPLAFFTDVLFCSFILLSFESSWKLHLSPRGLLEGSVFKEFFMVDGDHMGDGSPKSGAARPRSHGRETADLGMCCCLAKSEIESRV